MSRVGTFRISCYYSMVLLTLSLGFVLPVYASALLGVVIVFLLTRYLLFLEPFAALFIPRTMGQGRDFLLSYCFGVLLCAFMCVSLNRLNPAYSFRVSENLWVVFLVVPLQSFYEELIFRSVLQQRMLSSCFRGVFVPAVLVACVFSLSHWFNYKLTADVSLHVSTLVALFALGLGGGLLFKFQQNLSGTWGFHAGWNTLRFGLLHSVGHAELPEAATFNALEGSLPGVVVAGFILSAVVFLSRHARSYTPAANADL